METENLYELLCHDDSEYSILFCMASKTIDYICLHANSEATIDKRCEVKFAKLMAWSFSLMRVGKRWVKEIIKYF